MEVQVALFQRAQELVKRCESLPAARFPRVVGNQQSSGGRDRQNSTVEICMGDLHRNPYVSLSSGSPSQNVPRAD